MRRVLCALLERDGFRTVEASDGAAALELLAREPVDAILTDLRMPKLNGLELLEQVRRRHPEIPVVMLTAHGTVGSAVEALKQGAFDYLTKPFDPDDVRQVMEKAVSTRRLAAREARLPSDENPEPLLVGESALLARRAPRDRARRADSRDGADHRRERHRQGDRRAHAPPRERGARRARS